jgi:GNAT superfamily N-acetyltransferase
MTGSTPAVTVRRLERRDFDGWRPLWQGYLSFYRAELSDEVTELVFGRLCEGERGMLGLVAVDGQGQPVGLAHLIFHSSTWTGSAYCYLEDLFVDPGRRGGRVAQKLFDAVYETAREGGAERVYWHTQQFNGAARSLYDTVGQLTSFVVYEHDLD